MKKNINCNDQMGVYATDYFASTGVIYPTLINGQSWIACLLVKFKCG